MKAKLVMRATIYDRLSRLAIDLYISKKGILFKEDDLDVEEGRWYNPFDPILIEVIEELGFKACYEDLHVYITEPVFFRLIPLMTINGKAPTHNIFIEEVDRDREFVIVVNEQWNSEEIIYRDENDKKDWITIPSPKNSDSETSSTGQDK